MQGCSPEAAPKRLLALHKEIVDTAPGISSPEYRAFLYVADNEGVCQREVRHHLAIPQATASRLLAKLHDNGHALIDCTPNGRRKELRLSPKGRQLIARLTVLLGCVCIAPAAGGILAGFEPVFVGKPTGYDVCLDPRVFSCDLS